MSRDMVNLYHTANQVKTIGNTNPINMSTVPDRVLQAASPSEFSLLDNTKINNNASDAAAQVCRSYKDINGLRKLQNDQVNMSQIQTRCGWRYKPSTGLVPEISQGAMGKSAGPIRGEAGSPDEVTGGTQWFWDLEDAEAKISGKICQNATKCSHLSFLGQYADVCGYCKTTKSIIPTIKGEARYKTDNCLKKNIITAGGSCPAEGFTSFRQGNLNEVFKLREGFSGFDDLEDCNAQNGLTRDCVIKVAQRAGCSADGTLIQALRESTGDYDSVLKTRPSYNAYTSFMPLSAGLMKDGSVASMTVALNDFTKLAGYSQDNNNSKVKLSARDLCFKAGEFANYDFCVETGPETVVNAENIKCLQNMWSNSGGTTQGTGAPTLAAWAGKKFKEFENMLRTTLGQRSSSNNTTNSIGVMATNGTNPTPLNQTGGDLPMNENTRGAETVWFDLGNVADPNAPVVILKCDLRLKRDTSTKDGPATEVLPFIVTWTDLLNKYNLTSQNNKAYTSAFEIRNPFTNENTVRFGVTTDDGFILSKNQNPFENAGGGPDWGSWRYQGPTKYYSEIYGLDQGRPNIFVTKWFQGYGEAASQFWILRPKTEEWVRGADAMNVYLTQEPLAPWCQYEICARPNNEMGRRVGFFEKRWNGPSALNYQGRGASSFDVRSKNIAYETDPAKRNDVPGKKCYASFTEKSVWNTKSYFHFNSFRTISILVRPMASISPSGMASIFQHCNFKGYSAGMYLKSSGTSYSLSYGTSEGQFQIDSPVAMNEWNLIVIQYVGDHFGVKKITFNVEPLKNIQSESGRNTLLSKLNAGRTAGGSIVIGNPKADPLANAGMLVMGALSPADYSGFSREVPSFIGDVAWIHGFRNYLDTDELLRKEIGQGWISRWTVPNLPNEPNKPYSYQGCWKDAGDRALPTRLPNVTSVDGCAELSKKGGFNTFGLQYYGECWAGNNTNWNKHGKMENQDCGTLGSVLNNQIYKHL